MKPSLPIFRVFALACSLASGILFGVIDAKAQDCNSINFGNSLEGYNARKKCVQEARERRLQAEQRAIQAEQRARQEAEARARNSRVQRDTGGSGTAFRNRNNSPNPSNFSSQQPRVIESQGGCFRDSDCSSGTACDNKARPGSTSVIAGRCVNFTSSTVGPSFANSITECRPCLNMGSSCIVKQAGSTVKGYECGDSVSGSGENSQQQAPGGGNRGQQSDPDALIQQAISLCSDEGFSETLFYPCQKNNAEAVKSCDPENNSTMNSVMDKINGATSKFNLITGTSVAAACTDAAALLQGANAAVASFRISCSSSRSSCTKSCGNAMQAFKECVRSSLANSGNALLSSQAAIIAAENSQAYAQMKQWNTQCVQMNAKLQQAEQSIMGFMASTVNAQQCKDLTASGAGFNCATNPNLPGCPGAANNDCSNPANAGSLVCVCSSNPRDPRCSSAKTTPELGKATSPDFGGNPSGNKTGIDLGSSKLSGPANGGEGGSRSAASTGAADGSGGSPNLGGDGIGGSDSGGEGGSDSIMNPEVHGGFFSGSGSGFGALGSSGDSGSGDSLGSPDLYAGFMRGDQAPNLADFLPGGQADPRAVTGEAFPDGITGPNTNIWKKINNRYQVVEPTLLAK